MNPKAKVTYKGIDLASGKDFSFQTEVAAVVKEMRNDPKLNPEDVQLMSQLQASLAQLEVQKVQELLLGKAPAPHHSSATGIKAALERATAALAAANKTVPPPPRAALPPNPTPGGGYMGGRPKVIAKGFHWKLIAQYGLASKDARGSFWEGKTDAMMAELVSHQLAGHEVTSEHDTLRGVWVYKVYEQEEDE